jgi:hypothetical protein
MCAQIYTGGQSYKMFTNRLLCVTVWLKIGSVILRAYLNGLETGGRLTRIPVGFRSKLLA